MTVPTRQGVTDAAVIEQSWHEPGAFATLFERHAPHISRYVARRPGDDLADDVTAETFYRAFTYAPGTTWGGPKPARGCTASPPT
jgi:DNA-directed RNA polymerase specialized sigma24 family protein